VNAGTTGADGGEITMEARGTLRCSRPLKARGGGGASTGGTVELEAEQIFVDGDITATGGYAGGEIQLQSRGGRIEIGSSATSPIVLDVAGGNGGEGGRLAVDSAGNDVVVAVQARLSATNGGSSGPGGNVTIAGVAVTAAAGSQILADGTVTNGGLVHVQTRDTATLDGTVRATGGVVDVVYRSTPPTLGPGVVCPCTQTQVANLPPPCGDGVRRAGVEQCDEPDLNGQTCVSLGYASGALRCTATCTFDTSGCSGS
jgi:hypothetical protein